MTIYRRHFLQASAATTAALGTLGSVAFAAPQPAKKIPIGVQLWSVKGEFVKDMPGTLAKLAELGYQGAEPFGYGGQETVSGADPVKLRKYYDDAGLECCGIHMSPGALDDKNFKTTVDVNKTLGNDFLIVAANQQGMKSPEAIKQFAEVLNAKCEEAKKLDMRVGYHAHPFDFEMFDGKPAWQLLFEQTKPEVIMQLDIGNSMAGGGKPIDMLKMFPERCASLHIKECPAGPFGTHDIDWETIFTLCEKQSKTEWYVVEQVGLNFEMVAQAIEGIKKMGR